MSQRDLEAVIGRAVLDEAFRHLLFAAPEAALAGYEITETEVIALKLVDAESLDACAVLLGGRMQCSSARNESATEGTHFRSDI